MRLTSDRLGLLQTLGFTGNQARVYLALLDYPDLSAAALGGTAQVPRNRLYEALAELQSLGLVVVSVGKSKTCCANALTIFLDHRVSELQEAIRDLSSRRERLAIAFQPAEPKSRPRSPISTRALSGRRAVARGIDRMLLKATSHVAFAGTVGGFERILQHLTGAFEGRDVGAEVFPRPRSHRQAVSIVSARISPPRSGGCPSPSEP